jgi:hypothetical protein
MEDWSLLFPPIIIAASFYKSLIARQRSPKSKSKIFFAMKQKRDRGRIVKKELKISCHRLFNEHIFYLSYAQSMNIEAMTAQYNANIFLKYQLSPRPRYARGTAHTTGRLHL